MVDLVGEHLEVRRRSSASLQKAFIGERRWTAASRSLQRRNPTRITGRPDRRPPSGSVDSTLSNIVTRTLIGSGTNTAAKAKAAASRSRHTSAQVQRQVESYARKHGFAATISHQRSTSAAS